MFHRPDATELVSWGALDGRRKEWMDRGLHPGPLPPGPMAFVGKGAEETDRNVVLRETRARASF